MGAFISGGNAPLSGTYKQNPVAVSDGQEAPLLVDQFGNIISNIRPLVASSDTVAVVTLAGQFVTAQAQLYDAFGNPLRSVTPTSGINQLQINGNEASSPYVTWNGAVITTAATTYGTVQARNFREMLIVINALTLSTGLTLSWQIQDPNGNWVTAWSESLAAGAQVINIGRGYNADNTGASKPARNISIGVTGRLQAVATGTNATITGGVYFRTN